MKIINTSKIRTEIKYLKKEIKTATIALVATSVVGFCCSYELKKNHDIVKKCQNELKGLKISQPAYDEIVKKDKSVWSASETVAIWEEALSKMKIQAIRDSIAHVK